MHNKNLWKILATTGHTVKEMQVTSLGPHYAATLARMSSAFEGHDEWTGVIVRDADGNNYTISTMCSPVAAFMAVDYMQAAQDLGERGMEVATFMDARTCPGSVMHQLMTEHMPWLSLELPCDLLNAFPLTDDDGQLEHHKIALRSMATAIALRAEKQLAAHPSAEVREKCMRQLQMAAYMELRPGVLLALLLAGIYPQGLVSRIMREHLMAELELY